MSAPTTEPRLAAWSNWSRELTCTPGRIERPRTTRDVTRLVDRAAGEGLAVRPAGSGHSFTPLVPTDGVLVDLGAMDRILAVDVDRQQVRLQAGVRLGRLAELLLGADLAFQNLGDIDRQTVAGAIATGTHGTGASLGNLATQVVALQLVDGVGAVHELTAADGDPFLAARVGLGALGVVTEVTLQATAAYRLHGHDRVEPVDEVLDGFLDRAHAHRHFEAYAFPYSGHALTRTNDPAEGPSRPRPAVTRWAYDRLLATHLLDATCRLGRRLPGAIPTLNRTVSRLAGDAPRVDEAHRIFASPRDVRFTEMELALPREAGIPLVREVLRFVRRRRLPVNFPIEIRTSAGDDALLSPAYGRDTVYVAVHAYAGMPFADYFAGVWERARHHGARPHWGKRHPATAKDLRPRYPAWDRFAAVRSRLDPHGRFRNPHLDRVLGLVG
ncbi:D-arabinono-1,4-lactone oxidase [Egicoccus sp. AB-alg2]|uniref:D-arabinono-1,4-lactone oxidase n=1 Tax=Egicoccus sp. AB-alg2 TaxID=3242693 RepID=UPI00359E18EF